MISRYTTKDIDALFSDENRFATMVEVELLALEAHAALGRLPRKDAAAVRARQPTVDAAFVASVNAREAITRHDTAAFVDVLQAAVGGSEAAWIHYGLTSSDVVDTAWCKLLADAATVIAADVEALRDTLTRRAIETIDWPVLGRTHGIFAEPTTFGAKFALLALQVDRDLARIHRARAAIAVGKLSGAVGTYSNVDPEVERIVCERLGLTAVPATQVVARDRHAELLYACAAIGTTVEQLGLEIRHLARSEVAEVAEPFAEGQKGSSAMPHKRNPVRAERLCGLARPLRGYLIAGLEDVALWHERDISHSSVERVVLPDAVQLTVYLLREAADLVDGLVVDRERARRNLEELSLGVVFSQSVLHALVDSGLGRDEAYRIVQDDARQAVERSTPFREVLAADARVTLPADTLERAFDVGRLLAHQRRFLDALTWRTPR